MFLSTEGRLHLLFLEPVHKNYELKNKTPLSAEIRDAIRANLHCYEFTVWLVTSAKNFAVTQWPNGSQNVLEPSAAPGRTAAVRKGSSLVLRLNSTHLQLGCPLLAWPLLPKAACTTQVEKKRKQNDPLPPTHRLTSGAWAA